MDSIEYIHKSTVSAIKSTVKSILNGLSTEIQIVSNAMNMLKSMEFKDSDKYLNRPLTMMEEKYPSVVLSVQKLSDAKIDVDVRPHILASLISTVKAKKTFTIGCLIEFIDARGGMWENISWRTVHEILLEETFGEENIQLNDWDEAGRFTTFPEPSVDMDMYPCDKLICGFVALINNHLVRTALPSSPIEMQEIRTDPHMSHIGLFLERWIIKYAVFDKKGDEETRSSFIRSMQQVPSAKMAKMLMCRLPLYKSYGYVFESFAWPDLIKFIELRHRKYDPVNKMPLCEPGEFSTHGEYIRYRCTRFGTGLLEIASRPLKRARQES